MVFTAALVRPLGISMMPVMLITLAGMLQGFPVLSALYVWFPVALAAASAWTWVRVRDVIVELHLSEGAVAVRSLMDAAEPPSPLAWRVLLDSRVESGGKLVITLGHEEFRLIRDEWLHEDDLFNTLPTTT